MKKAHLVCGAFNKHERIDQAFYRVEFGKSEAYIKARFSRRGQLKYFNARPIIIENTKYTETFIESNYIVQTVNVGNLQARSYLYMGAILGQTENGNKFPDVTTIFADSVTKADEIICNGFQQLYDVPVTLLNLRVQLVSLDRDATINEHGYIIKGY